MNTFSRSIYIYSNFPLVALFWPVTVMSVLVFTSLHIHTLHNSVVVLVREQETALTHSHSLTFNEDELDHKGISVWWVL